MITPKYPTINSYEGVALYYLLSGYHISHLAFQGNTSSYCLRAPVFNLRAGGWPISDEWNAGNVSRFSGRRKKFKKYFISDVDLNALHSMLGERLRLFIEAAKRLESGYPQAANLGGGNAE
jgi:hypothetical protein